MRQVAAMRPDCICLMEGQILGMLAKAVLPPGSELEPCQAASVLRVTPPRVNDLVALFLYLRASCTEVPYGG